MHRHYLVVAMGAAVLDKLLVDLISASQVGIVHSLVTVLLPSFWLIFNIKDVIQRFKQILLVI